ncbi:MAG: Gfo/Idh/MocA family oxidoreductase [Planctomycetota bacterium]
MGMVGGGPGAFIGAVHRMAAALDGQIELVCGAFSSDPEKSKITGKELYLHEARVYDSYQQMIERERDLAEAVRMDMVSIVTPNHLHFPIAKMVMENGFHVMCDKPMTYDLSQAKELAEIVKRTGLLFGLTHNYTGYPMVKHARYLARTGRLGSIRKIVVEYPQGWLATKVEDTGQKQAEWRTDPKRSGLSSCIGDIGTHAENLAEYISGLRITELCADLTTFVPGRKLEDDGNILCRLENGARMVLYASQVSTGEENGLRIRVYGETDAIKWEQVEPNTLILSHLDGPAQILRAGANYPDLSRGALHNTRLPAGHPEGFIEAFANIYRNFALTLQCRLASTRPENEYLDFPTVDDGVRGMAFIETVVKSSQSDRKWTKMSL